MTKPCNGCGGIFPLTDFYKKRDTSDGYTSRCKACISLSKKVSYQKNKDKILAKNKQYYDKNSEAINQKKKDRYDSELNKIQCSTYYLNNKEKIRNINETWNKNNQETLRKSWRKYAKKNSANRNALAAKRRALKRNACPAWSNKEFNDFAIKEAYLLSKLRSNQTGFCWDVDHIIPLLNGIVCGLHVWNNLRVIPATQNRRKSNKFFG
jgi:hypothetical protein